VKQENSKNVVKQERFKKFSHKVYSCTDFLFLEFASISVDLIIYWCHFMYRTLITLQLFIAFKMYHQSLPLCAKFQVVPLHFMVAFASLQKKTKSSMVDPMDNVVCA